MMKRTCKILSNKKKILKSKFVAGTNNSGSIIKIYPNKIMVYSAQTKIGL